MAASTQERSEKTAKKRRDGGETELRMWTKPATRTVLAELMEWHGITEQAEAITLFLHHLHALGPEGSRRFLTPPRHEITVSPNVARKLEQFRIGRELRASDLLLGDDPKEDEKGLLLL
ncbi:hypothetical protein, partial [Brevundimonas sp.]|uniref:hypothetical protein n=1 Tax=Brevundimonas sp. TaxID=1871086 RepID=UPI0028A9D1D8